MKDNVEVIVDKRSKKKIDKTLRKNSSVNIAFKKAVIRLENNYRLGQQIPRERFPKEIVKEFHPTNLYVYDLIKSHPGWRLLYTLTPDGKVKILVVVLKLLNHHRYDRMFNY